MKTTVRGLHISCFSVFFFVFSFSSDLFFVYYKFFPCCLGEENVQWPLSYVLDFHEFRNFALPLLVAQKFNLYIHEFDPLKLERWILHTHLSFSLGIHILLE